MWQAMMRNILLKMAAGASALVAGAIICVALMGGNLTDIVYAADEAEKLDISISCSGRNCRGLLDDSYDTSVTFAADDVITVTSDTAMAGIYIKWNGAVNPWTLSYNGKTYNCGENGFVHEYIAFESETTECTINIPEKISISDIMAYGKGTLPADVQVWDEPCENADIVAFAAHADDEILFLGGVLATYGGDQGLALQVVYMCDFWNKEPVREHEKIDGLWEIGIRNYPVCLGFADIKSLSLEKAKQIYSYDEVTEAVTAQIRRFKPLIVVTQDLNGEYGHGAHMLLAHAVCDAVDGSASADYYPSSVEMYGTHDVSKTYLHLYTENKIKLNLRTPLANLGGRTALEAASDAYLKHVSQQVWDFIVSDDYEHSCAEFGLYRTTVGYDTGNDMLEHITTYEEAERIKAAEQASIEASVKASEEAESAKQAGRTSSADVKADNMGAVIVIAAGVVVAVIVILCLVNYANTRKRRRRLKERRKHDRR